MSVWSEICYSTDTLCTLLKHINPVDVDHPVLDAFCKDSYVPNPSVGDALPAGNLVNSIRKSPLHIKVLEPFAFSKPVAGSKLLLDFLADGEVLVGLSAIYQLIPQVDDHSIKWSNEWDWKWLKVYVARMLKCNQYASYQSPRDADGWIARWLERTEWGDRMQRFDNMAETFNHLHYVFNTESHKRANKLASIYRELTPPLSRKTLDFGSGWQVRRFGTLTILTELSIFKNRHYVLTLKDLNRCSQMCSSLADLELYFANYGDVNSRETMYEGYRNVLAFIMQAMRATGRPNELARACDVAAALLLSRHATDVWQKAVTDQAEKIEKENLYPVLDVDGFTSLLDSYPLAEAVELSKVYKFLPVPDFDFLTLFNKQREKHEQTNPCFGENDIGLDLDDFKLYQRHQLIITYFARHRSCPGSIRSGTVEKPWHTFYPFGDPGGIPYTETGDIEFTTKFQYEKVGVGHNPYIKDKALAPNFPSQIVDEPDLRDRNPADTSYLLHYLLSSELATPQAVAEGMSQEEFEVGHTTEPKGETKKGLTPRNFYLNNYPGRILVSELDNNIAEYVRFKPGSFTGLSRADAFNKFQDISGTELEKATSTYVYVSFDIAAWSPKQNPAMRRLQLEKWAEAFGVPYLTEVDRQFTGADVHYIHKGIHQRYTINGNDLEGYVGRLNTDLHIDVMGYAVRKLRESGLIQSGAKLAVQIDDGLCVLRFQPDTSNADIITAVTFIEKVYRWASFEISWDKTYVSRKLRVFLNELDYDKVRITPGVKAFLRIRREHSGGIRCFLREANKAAGMVTGAIESGCAPVLAWLKYAVEVGKVILDWSRKITTKLTPEEAALWSFVPVSHAGAGCLAMLHYASNTTEDATAAGLSILKAIATYDHYTRAPINKFLNQPIQGRSPLSTLRDPMKFRVEGATMSDMLEMTYAKDALRDKVVNPVVQEAMLFSEQLTIDIQTSPLPSPVGTKGKAIQLAYEASALATVDGILMKFARSSTIIKLIGSRRSMAVFLQYRGQFRRSYSNAAMLLRE